MQCTRCREVEKKKEEEKKEKERKEEEKKKDAYAEVYGKHYIYYIRLKYVFNKSGLKLLPTVS